MEKTGSKAGAFRTLQIVLLVGIVVAFPLISFLVNMKGAEQGKAFYSELKKDFGKMPKFGNLSWTDDAFDSTKTKGKVLVATFLNGENRDSMLALYKTLNGIEQFQEEVDNLFFLSFDNQNDSTFIMQYRQSLSPREKAKWFILRGDSSLTSGVKMPSNYSVALVDTAGTIRRFYDIRQLEEKRLLVEHIAVMPIKRKKNVEKKDKAEM